MSGKKRILEKLQQNKPDYIEHPGSFVTSVEKNNQESKIDAFIENLSKNGAEVHLIIDSSSVQDYIDDHYPSAIGFRNPDDFKLYAEGIQKEEFEKIDAVILEGQFGVSENGAIWFDESNFSKRILPFIINKLIAILGKDEILETMHEAYEKIEGINTGFGVFISGPSKTADIEQSLVLGAHGAKEFIVILV